MSMYDNYEKDQLYDELEYAIKILGIDVVVQILADVMRYTKEENNE